MGRCTYCCSLLLQYDETLVGHQAAQRSTDAANTFYSFKRLIGRK